MMPISFLSTIALWALSQSSLVAGHSWVEQLNVIAPNGTFTSTPGYPRGWVSRSDPHYSDPSMQNLIPPADDPQNLAQPICKSTQRTQNQTAGAPMLQAAPGAMVALRYQENGHVSQPNVPEGKPAHSGTNFVYYTDSSKPDDKFLDIHRVWNADGSGGDRRGRLISTRNFDDGQCYLVNNGFEISVTRQKEYPHTPDQLQGVNLWCQQDIKIPTDAKPGSTITLYWVWDWPTMPGSPGAPNGKQEIYTTCMDIAIVEGTGAMNKAAAVKLADIDAQNRGNAAVPSQFQDISNPTAVASPAIVPFSSKATVPTSSASASSGSSSPSQTTAQTTTAHTSSTSITSPKAKETVTETVTVTAVATTSGKPNLTRHTNATSIASATQTTTTKLLTRAIATTTSPKKVHIVTEDETVTVTVSNVMKNLQSKSLDSSIEKMANATRRPTLTNDTAVPRTSSFIPTSVPSTTTTTSAPCSKTASAYRLRARAPFYIIHPGDATGC